MAGIYVHIPFCKQACHYCDFHFTTNLKSKESLVNALVKEFHLRQAEGQELVFGSVYFGGGTPSLLSGEELQVLLDALSTQFRITDDAEITLEANPDDLDQTTLANLANGPVNRLSIGVQSFRNEDLRWMNRAHNASEAEKSIELAKESGFQNFTIDLIYGIPGQSNIDWFDNLCKAFELEVPHFSAYCLTVEANTALARFVEAGKSPPVDEEQAAVRLQILIAEAKKNGYVQYEISNFAKEGYFAKHNSGYWKQEPYLGFGPSAHSFLGTDRRWNVANTPQYIQSINSGNTDWFEMEHLSPADQCNEHIMCGLRTMWGCDLTSMAKTFGEEALAQIEASSLRWISTGHLQRTENKLVLTPKGRLLADRIASDLFLTNGSLTES